MLKNLQKNTLFPLFIIALILGVGVLLFPPNKAQEAATDKINISRHDQKTVGTVKISDGERTYTYDVKEGVGQTALNVTRFVTSSKVRTEGEGENAFVTSILGREAKVENKEFWEFIINGQPAMVGAGSYIFQEGDKIEWRISKF